MIFRAQKTIGPGSVESKTDLTQFCHLKLTITAMFQLAWIGQFVNRCYQ